jgi:ATP-binding cassette subfamily B protein
MRPYIRHIVSRLRKAFSQLPYLGRALAIVHEAAGNWTLLWVILLIIRGLLPVATVTLTKALVDSLVVTIESGGDWETMRTSLLLALSMGLILLLQEILRGANTWVSTSQTELVRDHISSMLHRQSIALDLAFYDSPEYFDHLHRARYEAAQRPITLLENLGSMLQNSITMVAMAAVLITYAWWLPIALVVSTLPALFVVLQHTTRQYEWDKRTTADRRKAAYYDYLLTARNSAAELRLFSLGDHFRSRFQTLRTRLRDERLSLLRDLSIARLVAGILALLIMGVTMVWMVWQALQGNFTLGDLALLYAAFNQGQNLMRSLLQNLGQIYGNMLFLGNLFEFLALEPGIVDSSQAQTVQPPEEGLRFVDVTFRYPDSERTALQHFDLDIPAGKMVAIVGVNGAGKTTLLKLLCRFYDPQSGHIELDGTDLRNLSLAGLRRSVTVLFQEPVPYQNSAARNIAFGDLASDPDQSSIYEAAIASGADSIIAQLPEGYETRLGKWFKGGTDLSVGEWQRVALARAFLRQAPIIILDEPTSAMDPWAETDWLQRFRALADGKTAVIITHRFTTAMHAETIHVMDNGRIVESGSHEELLALDGRYAQSWQAQMRGRGVNTSDANQ